MFRKILLRQKRINLIEMLLFLDILTALMLNLAYVIDLLINITI